MWTGFRLVKNIKNLQALVGDFSTITDPGNAGTITAATSGIVNIVSAGAGHTRSLAAPAFNGQTLCLWHHTDGGDVVVTCATTFTEAGANTWSSDEDGDYLTLIAMDDGGTLKWRAVGGDTAAGIFTNLSTV